MAVTITGRNTAITATGIILTILFITSIGGPEYGVVFDFPTWATCSGTDCYIEGTVSHNWTSTVCIPKGRLRGDFKDNVKGATTYFWGDATGYTPIYGYVEHTMDCSPFEIGNNDTHAWCVNTDGDNNSDTIFTDINRYNSLKPQQDSYKYDVNEIVSYDEYTYQDWVEYPTERCFEPNVAYPIRIDFEAPINTVDKFNITFQLPVSMDSVEFVLDPWYSTAYPYRQEINVEGDASYTDLPVKISLDNTTVGANFNWTNNGSDLVFINSTNDSNPFWIESWSVGGETAVIWLNAHVVASGNTTYYMYYGNTESSALSNCYSTFTFCEPWDSATINATNWVSVTYTPTYTIDTTNNWLSVTLVASSWGQNAGFHSKVIDYPSNWVLESLHNDTGGASGGVYDYFYTTANNNLQWCSWQASDTSDVTSTSFLTEFKTADAHSASRYTYAYANYNATTDWSLQSFGSPYTNIAALRYLNGYAQIYVNETLRSNQSMPDLYSHLNLVTNRLTTYTFGTHRFGDMRIRQLATTSPIIYIGAEEEPAGLTTITWTAGHNTSVGGGGVEATGGTVTYSGGYTIHTFSSNSTFTVSSGGEVEYLIVGGGGGGGQSANGGGGGGAGGFRTGTPTVSVQGYTITVGAGGAADTNGFPSSAFSIESAGGGRGAATDHAAGTGGSGGGGSLDSTFDGEAGNTPPTTPVQGYAGGTTAGSGWHGGSGGGGAGGVGLNGGGGTSGSSFAGDGGPGVASSISGSSVTYAGGGGGENTGNADADKKGDGGAGGGGTGGTDIGGTRNADATNGTANTGGGGGGGRQNSGSGPTLAGTGGSGIVIIRYLTPQPVTTHTLNWTTDQGALSCNLTFGGTWYNQTDDCYQETATTATDCGGLSTGAYSCSGSFSDACVNLYDEDWTTKAKASADSEAYVYMNYTKPTAVTGAVWQIGTGTNVGVPTLRNDTIPSNCLSQTPLQLRVYLCSNSGGTCNFGTGGNLDGYSYQCYNGTGFEPVYSDSWDFATGSPGATEEGIYWDIPKTDWYQTITPVPQGNTTDINVTCTDGTDTVTSSNVWVYYGLQLPTFTWSKNVTVQGNYDLQNLYNVADLKFFGLISPDTTSWRCLPDDYGLMTCVEVT